MANFEELQRIVQLKDIKTNLISLSGSRTEVITLFSTDTNEMGLYDGSTFYWIGGGSAYSGSAPISIAGSVISHAISGVSAGTYLSANIVVDSKGHITSASSGASASSIGAPSDSPFVTSGSSSNLTNYRILTAGSNITITSSSANGGSIRIDSSGGGATETYALIRDEKTNGTNGGTFTSGAWQTRDLNTEVIDTGSFLTLATNQFTLLSGTYRISARAPAIQVSGHQAKLYNITDAADVLLGSSGYASSAHDVQDHSFVIGEFTISGSKTFEIRHRSFGSMSAFGFGADMGIGSTNVYTTVELWKL